MFRIWNENQLTRYIWFHKKWVILHAYELDHNLHSRELFDHNLHSRELFGQEKHVISESKL